MAEKEIALTSMQSWMPAILSADLPPATVVPVRRPGGTLALWRSASGRPSAFDDRCPHRGMRLSHGFVRGEVLSCIYHGWSYGEAGNCVRIPAHPGLKPPAAIRVGTHQATESDGIVWIAAGEPPDGQSSGPPALSPLVPLRSLTADASLASLEAAAGGAADAAGLLDATFAGTRLCALLAPLSDKETLIHVLVEGESGLSARTAASRAAEALRRAAEATERGADA